ncbi:hypothetical protein [Paenibacillus sp. FSL L8-0709]|uniref:hypothetical protein n=1 Tax=Paenibacillus sp. FSL L8-0709 TaxID=2975312 RepID=UPI0030F51CDE
MEKDTKFWLGNFKGVLVELDPQGERGYFNPLEIENMSSVTVSDLVDSSSSFIKPYSVVAEATGISLEEYEKVVQILENASNGFYPEKN